MHFIKFTWNVNMLIGAHLSTSGGLTKTFAKAREIGANCLQIFSSSPRDWSMPKMEPIKLEITPVYFHAGYLINLADDGEIGRKSVELLIAELNLAGQMGVKGSIVHLGSFKTSTPQYDILYKNIRQVLANIPDGVLFIIENSGNKKIGQNLDEIKKIIDVVGDPRLRVCLDTCHLFAAGYPFDCFDYLDFFDSLELIHINDSKDPFGSGRDRHENIGKGTIGLENFKKLFNNPKLKDVPFITEVPGFDGKGPDKENLDLLKKLYRAGNTLKG